MNPVGFPHSVGFHPRIQPTMDGNLIHSWLNLQTGTRWKADCVIRPYLCVVRSSIYISYIFCDIYVQI